MQQLGASQRRAPQPGEPPDPSRAVPRVNASTTRPGMPHLGPDVLVEKFVGLNPLPPIPARLIAIAEGERSFAQRLAQANSSGPALTATALEWTAPHIRPALDQGGGPDGLAERPAMFLEHTVRNV
jgi:hypothetical protein